MAATTNAAAIEALYQASAAPIEAQIANLTAAYNESKKQLAAENAAKLRQEYLASQQKQRTMPNFLQLNGVKGGGTETAYADMTNNYQNNRNAQNQTYLNGLSQIQLGYNQNMNSLQASLAAARQQANAQLAALTPSYSGSYSKGSGDTFEEVGNGTDTNKKKILVLAPGSSYGQTKKLDTDKYHVHYMSGR